MDFNSRCRSTKTKSFKPLSSAIFEEAKQTSYHQAFTDYFVSSRRLELQKSRGNSRARPIEKSHYRKSQDLGELITIEELGESEGRFGRVYRVFSKIKGCFFAKKIHREWDDENTGQEYFALKRIIKYKKANRSSKLLEIVDPYYSKEEKVFFAVTEFGRGTLDDVGNFLAESKSSWLEYYYVIIYHQISEQLADLRAMRLVHGDIKPSNIILSEDLHFKLIDFGNAFILEKEGEQYMVPCGTPRFMHLKLLEALSRGKDATAMVDPYETDEYSLRASINFVMKKNGILASIDELVEKYPKHTLGALEINNDFRRKYDIFLVNKLYSKLSSQDRMLKLYIFIRYYKIEEIDAWLDYKLHEGRTDEMPVIYYMLGDVNRYEGRYLEAMQYYLKCEESLPKQPSIMLGILYSSMGKAQKEINLQIAYQYHIDSRRIKVECFTEQSAEVAEEEYNLGFIRYRQGRFQEALEYYEKALKACEVGGEDAELHRHITRHGIALVMSELGRHSEAKDLLEGEIDNSISFLGKNHMNHASILNNLGMAYNKLRRYKEALKLFKKGIQILVYNKRGGHRDTAYILNSSK